MSKLAETSETKFSIYNLLVVLGISEFLGFINTFAIFSEFKQLTVTFLFLFSFNYDLNSSMSLKSSLSKTESTIEFIFIGYEIYCCGWSNGNMKLYSYCYGWFYGVIKCYSSNSCYAESSVLF